MPSGEGYHLCRTICQQPMHAEVDAVIQAGMKVDGATIYLEGHTYACADCQAVSAEFGVKEIVVGPPPPVTDPSVREADPSEPASRRPCPAEPGIADPSAPSAAPRAAL